MTTYIPAFNSFTDKNSMYKVIRSFPFATLIHGNQDTMQIHHLPILMGDESTLICHIARNNPLREAILDDPRVTIVFKGVETYISPNWYASKESTGGKVVPTWDYEVVHVKGRALLNDDAEFVKSVVSRLTDVEESKLESEEHHVWKVDDAPKKYLSLMLRAIVGVTISIDEIIGKCKMSQNKDVRDLRGIVHGLQQVEETTNKQIVIEHIESVITCKQKDIK